METEEGDLDSSLTMYRNALHLRGRLETAEELEWVETGRDDVLAFRRPNGWTVVTNFGTEPFAYNTNSMVLSSEPVEPGEVPGETTVWLSE